MGSTIGDNCGTLSRWTIERRLRAAGWPEEEDDFRKQRGVDGCLEISASNGADDERLRCWIHDSEVMLPALQAMARKHDQSHELRDVLLWLKDLGRRVEAVERELSRLRRSPA